MAYDGNQFNAAWMTTVDGSFNEDTNNSDNLDVDVSDSFNEENTTTDSGNTTVGVDGSFNSDFDNTWSNTEDSNNQTTTTNMWSYIDESTTDNSINAGLRSYDTGFSGVGGAAAGAAGGDVMINNQNSIVDQSVNQNIAADGPVWQNFESSSVSASGDDALAAGGDISVDTYVDQSTSISADGDVLIDSEKTVTWTEDSFNTSNYSYTETDASVHTDISDSYNSHSWDTTVEGSFNEDTTAYDIDVTDINVDAVVDSYNTSVGDIDFAL